ncbi:MAG: hypothetical protein KZQ60_12850 [Candidatus Thiodiazotropha sp. (ex Lucinoma aequizonata)]|nr:hypothetical protein [Candidatus Thiodiazotropha sp. (ex Lucinoma aequizonata)]MCU7888031.1 hypothetical protein [Candidatus Thiodiazotropha sp. (ex Lucinoma aequizonata)]MCU7909685.1 hypothetical protein [Candidatus Thiodiazotropha sp. (ex Lucinoma aequizonata)]MCU7910872.1 hypothetical protein [Candidatus Thiodiazotropha sp. (ex Lucinoma aequizonata)]
MQESEKQPERRRTADLAGKMIFFPNFCALRAVFAVVVIGELLAILLTLAAVDCFEGFLAAMSPVSLLVQWIGLSTAGLLCAMCTPLCRLGNQWAGFVAFLILIGMTALSNMK